MGFYFIILVGQYHVRVHCSAILLYVEPITDPATANYWIGLLYTEWKHLWVLHNLSIRKQHSFACFRHDVHSFWNGFPLSISDLPFLVLSFAIGKGQERAWRSLPLGQLPWLLQPLWDSSLSLAPGNPHKAQRYIPYCSSSATGFIHRVCVFLELIATTVKYWLHRVLTLFAQAVSGRKESMLGHCWAYFTFVLHSIFFFTLSFSSHSFI